MVDYYLEIKKKKIVIIKETRQNKIQIKLCLIVIYKAVFISYFVDHRQNIIKYKKFNLFLICIIVIF
jgi:hypothetical protein